MCFTHRYRLVLVGKAEETRGKYGKDTTTSEGFQFLIASLRKAKHYIFFYTNVKS